MDTGQIELPPGLELKRDDKGLALVGGDMELRGDFAHMLPRMRRANLHRELLVRAARIKGVAAPVVVDATAGLGEDSLLLAAVGCEVTLCERDTVIAALLRDALERAANVPELSEAVGRMRLVEGDSIHTLRWLGASNRQISAIFVAQSWLITLAGAATGVVLGLLLCLCQQHFGWLKLQGDPASMVVHAYPVQVVWTDLLMVLAMVAAVGALTAFVVWLTMRRRLRAVSTRA